MKDYSDIINIKYPFKKTNTNRAVQFMPFSALSLFNEEIKKQQKILNKKIELTEQQKDILDYKLEVLKNNLNLEIIITYFIKENKDEGNYNKISGKITKIDKIKKQILINNILIQVKDIIDIEIRK